jgi:hypothetical protein
MVKRVFTNIPWKIRGRTVGYIRGGTYYIWRTVAGRRVRLTTSCVTEQAARAEYERFELSPSTYVNRLGRRALPLGSDPARAVQLRNNRLALRYKLTSTDYDALLALQDGRCAICGARPTETKRGGLEVDHCHATGVVRGLLCGPCNRGIGNLGDSLDLLRKAVAYMEAGQSKGDTLIQGGGRHRTVRG